MRRERVVLPNGQLSPKVHVACEAKNWREIVSRLQAAAPNEACTFVLNFVKAIRAAMIYFRYLSERSRSSLTLEMNCWFTAPVKAIHSNVYS